MKLLFLPMLAAAVLAANPTLDIKVDQVGYLNGGDKVALVVSPKPAAGFTVNQAKDGKIAFRGTLSSAADDFDSGDRVQTADFTRLIKSGTYYIDVPGVGRSWNFDIAPDVYAKAWRLVMRSYYGQRCGIAVNLDPDFPGYQHAACHLAGAYDPSSGKTGVHAPPGGWHNSGDYGRYLGTSGVTSGTLLWTYEMYSSRLKGVNLNIPESGNGQPDMLSEIKWNLDWMRSMQDEDGGVWPEQIAEKPAGLVMPDADKLVSYVIGIGQAPFKSSSATGDFAAVMAIAGRVYQPSNPAYATKCLRAAEKAWAWLEKSPNATFRNRPGMVTPNYVDDDCADEHLWAAAELFRTTGESAYARYFLDHYAAFAKPADEADAPSWANVGAMALWTYAMAPGADYAAANNIRRNLIANADEIANRSTNNRYRVSLAHGDYLLGSNGQLASYGMELLMTGTLTHNSRYTDAALEDLHYLLGRNTFSLSFVSRVGQNSVRHLSHRPSMADGLADPWPGLLAAGPNRDRGDPLTNKLAADLPPAKIYLDDQQAFSVNEVAIQWNAPLVFLLAGAPDAVESPAAGRGKISHETNRRR